MRTLHLGKSPVVFIAVRVRRRLLLWETRLALNPRPSASLKKAAPLCLDLVSKGAPVRGRESY